MTSVRVALDAMGGDHAPGSAVAGALRAAQEHGVDVVLVGDAAVLAEQLCTLGADGALPIVDAPDVVGMDEDPVIALRSKPEASIRVACRLVARGEAAGLVSAGSTGATLTAALLTLGRSEGVRRPVVAAALPIGDALQQERNGVVLADAGGSMDVQPEALVGYAAMARAYAQVLGATAPRIGLLNVGHEPGKGNAATKQAHVLLQATGGFVGNVEPAGVLAGDVDVVVTDGFTGNVFLKTLEAGRPAGAGDADTVASLLGVKGEVLVAHGDASAEDVTRALRRAAQVVGAGLAARISGEMTAAHARRDDGG